MSVLQLHRGLGTCNVIFKYSRPERGMHKGVRIRFKEDKCQ